jgi:glycosyltransferase involved in cell wall biosynthesis
MTEGQLEWQIAVFCQNERRRIEACLTSISAAVELRRARITVIINGSTDGSEEAARAASVKLGTPMQIFSIPQADKSNAINCFIHDRRLRADADMYFFVDGYTIIGRNALAAMAGRLAECPDAVAATGVAANGRTEIRSRQTTVEIGGVMHGQFYALRPDFVRRMADGGIRLPIGLYRGDGLLGSMAAHDLDALGQPWLNSRLIGVVGATFEIDALSLFRMRDLRRQFRRKIRQMRGRLENEAVKQVIYTGGYAALPPFADDMIRDFLAANPMPTVPLLDRPFLSLALRHHRAARCPAPESLQPTPVT